MLCCVFIGSLVLSNCDSDTNFSPLLEDISFNNDLTDKARAWYMEQMLIEVSNHFSKISSVEDSLALLSFIEKFPPDWDNAAILSIDGTEETLVMTTTLGKHTDERYDTTMYHVRVLVMNMKPSGDVISGNIITFSSEQRLSKDNFVNYVEQYIAKDFGNIEMKTSRYSILLENIDAYIYRPNQFPFEITLDYISERLDFDNVRKNNNFYDYTCYLNCYVHAYSEICAGPLSNTDVSSCGDRYRILCSTYCYNSGGGFFLPLPTTGGNTTGGSNSNNQDDNDDNEDCTCSNRQQCELATEYNDPINWPCSKFYKIDKQYLARRASDNIVPRYEEKHNGFGYISDKLDNNVRKIRSNFGRDFYVTPGGGYRCIFGQKAAKGVDNSQHLYGTAADLNPPYSHLVTYDGVTNVPYWTHEYKINIANYAKNTLHAGWTSLYEGSNHVHVDWR